MASHIGIVNSVYAFGKRLLSYRKSDWILSDYPIRTRTQKFDPELNSGRFTQHRFLSYIVNWGLSGSGDTRDEAIRNLASNFHKASMERTTPIPRPGTNVPVEFASSAKVDEHPELAEDFIHRVLELQWAWISDDSSLWDFHHHESNDAFHQKIKEVYGVDVSDLESAKLAEILERIAQSNSPKGRVAHISI